MCAYAHTCLHTYLHTYIHAYVYTYTHTRIHKYPPAQRHLCIRTYMHTSCTYIQAHTCGIVAHSRDDPDGQTCGRNEDHTNTHSHAYTYTSTYTFARHQAANRDLARLASSKFGGSKMRQDTNTFVDTRVQVFKICVSLLEAPCSHGFTCFS